MLLTETGKYQDSVPPVVCNVNVKLKEYFNISDALIGVHCTHGVNRTGYLICRYLIEKLDWDPQKAIDGKVINLETVFCCHFNSKRKGNSSLVSSLFELKQQ